MRKFTAWIACNHVGAESVECTFEVPNDATKADIEATGDEAINSLLENFDSGWNEIEPKPKRPKKKPGAPPGEEGPT